MTKTKTFLLDGMVFEYDMDKNISNIKKHGISFEVAARVFLDYDRIEMYDGENSHDEDRYDTIGGISVASRGHALVNNILFVVYTERLRKEELTVIRIISARWATSFERGLYYGKY